MSEDIEYLAMREARERAAMQSAADPHIAALHGQMAQIYARRRRAIAPMFVASSSDRVEA